MENNPLNPVPLASPLNPDPKGEHEALSAQKRELAQQARFLAHHLGALLENESFQWFWNKHLVDLLAGLLRQAIDVSKTQDENRAAAHRYDELKSLREWVKKTHDQQAQWLKDNPQY